MAKCTTRVVRTSPKPGPKNVQVKPYVRSTPGKPNCKPSKR